MQTSALPLGYVTDIKLRRWSGKRDSNSRPPPWQGGALPLSYFRIEYKIGGDTQNRTGDKGFADLCLTAWLCRHMERKTGLEPATPTLARLCSTTELLPHLLNSDIIISQFCLLSSLIFSDRTDVSLGISATFGIVSYRLLRVNRKFSFSQDVHFTVSTLAVRRKVLYTILSYFASGF